MLEDKMINGIGKGRGLSQSVTGGIVREIRPRS
ncbi:hypothetical protein VP193E371_P0161 [Vibrio phage 193E37-1]|nr:hypothetical protein VP495E541_P0159 [Vibrio phage 495E54-1]CAH9014121.1 hypothetical protein VP496E541_P0160 [Vibrio phage 496E54-1]CAH9017224.1 hypothetical protein VP193E371_P0161 [Vibrio phage 193E37-1]